MMRQSRSRARVRHEAGKNQRRCPNGIAERESAQSQPERFKNQRTDSGKEKNSGKNRESHGGDNSVLADGVILIPQAGEKDFTQSSLITQNNLRVRFSR